MDSGNTSSLHSSSGGGGGGSEDVDSLSAFFHTSASPSGVALPTPLPPSSSSSSVGSHFLDYYSLFYHDSSSSPAPDLPSASGSQPSTAAVEAQADPPAAPPPRNSRKRSRASRRAPTTVLTTDTSNFRAMVQEFTGIPAAPFAVPSVSSSPFLRPRIDQFLHPSSSAAAVSPFFLRPFPHKPNSPPSVTNPIPNPPTLPPSLNLTNTASTSASATLSNPIPNQLLPNLHSLLHPPIPPTFFASDDFAALPPALFVPDPAPSNWGGIDFSGAGVSRPHISAAAGSCKPSYASSAAPTVERVIGEKPDAEVAGRNSDNAAEPSWIRSSSD